MDAVKFIVEKARMCGKQGECDECKLNGSAYCNTMPQHPIDREGAQEAVDIVEQWSKEHPSKTRQSVFLEQYPNCMIDSDGVVGICPRNVNNKCICNFERFYDCHGCPACRREFWMQEVE